MFQYEGYLDRSQFARAAVLRVGLFVASVLGFPFLLLALKTIAKCGHDTCGAVGLIGAMAFKPLAFAIFTFSLVGISIRRTRDAGVPGWVGLFIPLLFLADYAFLVFSGAPWSFAFSAGQLRSTFPQFAVLALGCIVILCKLPPRDVSSPNPYGYTGLVALGLGSYIAAFALLAFAATIPAFSSAIWPISSALYIGTRVLPFTMVGLIAALVWMTWQAQDLQMTRQRPTTATSNDSKLPIITLAIGAAALTAVAISTASSKGLSIWLLIVVQFIPMVMPTFLLYFSLLACLYLLATRRTLHSAILTVVVMLPFAHWLYAHWSTAQQHKRETAEIAAYHTAPAASRPPTMVIDSDHVTAIRAAWTVAGIDSVILRGAYGSSLMQVARPRPEDRFIEPNKISSLPDEYLHLRIGRSSSFTKERQMYNAAGGPLELRLVSQNRNDLIAVWYRAYNPSPSLVPILTANGWFRGTNSASTEEIEATVSDFLNRALSANS